MADIGRRIVWWAVVVAAIMWWSPPGEALAADFGVNSTLDADDAARGNGVCATITPGQCTLRAAIREANALGGGPHNITLPPSVYTLTLTGDDDTAQNGDLDITATITINGIFAPANFIQACDAVADPNCTGIDRVFEVHPGGSLSLVGVTVRKGNASESGGGIMNRGTLVLTNAVLNGNRTAAFGGGLQNQVSSSAILTSVSVTNNEAPSGGGVHNVSAVVNLTNVTISGNTAANGFGGGLRHSGGSSAASTLTNVTIANNASTNSVFTGAGIRVDSGTLILRNSIVANNTLGTSTTSNCAGSGTITPQGFNLVFPGSGCGFSAGTNDLVDVDPKLGPLQANGVPVPTHALPPGSPAIDAGNPATSGSGGAACATADARGVARPADGDLNGTGRCDIGAYELASFTVNANFDADDAARGNGVCATSTPNQCTLRAAVREANALGGAAIRLPADFFSLTLTGADNTAENGDLDVTAALLIAGSSPSLTFVQACNFDTNPQCIGIDRLFHVQSEGSLTIRGVTLRKGNTGGGGGGILNQGMLTLTHVLLDGNDSSQQGGALSNGATGAAFLTNVSITSNQAVDGGGIANFGEVLSLTNVTISGNTATTGNGGGLFQAGSTVPEALLANVTISDNAASTGNGGGLFVDAGQITLRNSIVANNTLVAGGSSNCAGGGNFTPQGFNLVFPGAGCGFATETNDRLNADPKLGPLANNGGQTPTIALLPGSAAIDAGNPGTPGSGGATCAAADQRGQARTDGNNDGTVRCDIGAFELVPVPIDLAVSLTDGVSAPPPGANLTYTLTVTNPGGVTVSNIQVAGTFPPPLTNVTWGCHVAVAGSSAAPCNGSGNLASSLRLPAGGSVTYTVQATVPGGTALGTQIAASATITPPAGVADPNAANNSATDTDTVTAPSCSPRPRVVVQVAPAGAGRLQVTLTPSTNPGQAANQIQAVRLGTLQNAAVDVPVQPGVPAAQNGLTSGAQVGLTGPVASLNLVVRRVPPPGITTPVAFTAPMTVTDGCGAWPTLAGGGTGVP